MNSTCELGRHSARALKPYSDYKDSGVEWLRDVPAHWHVCRVKTIASVFSGGTPSSTISAYWGGDIVWLTPQDLGAFGECLVGASTRGITREGYDSSGATLAPAGSVAISTRAPIGHVGILSITACTNQGCRLLVPTSAVRSDYLCYSLKVARATLESLGQGTTFPELSRDALAAFPVSLPPVAEQAAIVRFLDHADRRIRRYVRAKQKLIVVLEEQKQAVIHQAVTGQIDVRTGRPYPKYKPSRAEWLGAVPESWQVRRSKRVFASRKELAGPNDTQLSATQAYGVIAQVDYEKRVGRKVVKILRHLERRQHVEIDDFVISMRSFQGGLERAWETGCIRSSYIVLQPATRLAVGYFGHLFKSIGYITALRSTANFIRDGQDLNYENFCRVDLPFPPIEEQHRITMVLDRAAVNIDSIIERSRRQIGSLGEYRTRLIADVVTGKLDVREAAAGLPQVDPLAAEGDSVDGVDHEAGLEHTVWRHAVEEGDPLTDVADA